MDMAIPDINHKVCIMCDHYTEDDCPYCGMGFEGFSVEKHDMEISRKIRVDVIDECIKVMKYCWYNGQQPLNILVSRLENLKEQK